MQNRTRKEWKNTINYTDLEARKNPNKEGITQTRYNKQNYKHPKPNKQ
ncbi:hypothetical protein PXD04_06920 [Methanosphaera sp. ISO3-F5]|nr:hypothetical protein [Methanosphaera sp. ISO3-F5]WQH63435.1 hypothetical protein PXD04_06920 [Methanosphaera sp. ISO3-F5]